MGGLIQMLNQILSIYVVASRPGFYPSGSLIQNGCNIIRRGKLARKSFIVA